VIECELKPDEESVISDDAIVEDMFKAEDLGGLKKDMRKVEDLGLDEDVSLHAGSAPVPPPVLPARAAS
jgi:hypothetical protein